MLFLLFLSTFFLGSYGYLPPKQEIKQCNLDNSGKRGICVNLANCEHARNMLKDVQNKKSSKLPQVCGFDGARTDNVLVCCEKTKSEIACYKYHQLLSYICQASYNGVPALSKTYPHMAILGYGNENNNKWLCGGSLISENFVLTAAHCIKSKQFGIVRRVRLGDLDVKNQTDDAQPQDFTVKQTFVYPKYKSSSHYHDIGLIQLDRNIIYSEYVIPTCLPPKNFYVPQTDLIGAGWGQKDFVGETSSHLLQVFLDYINHETCKKRYENVSPGKLKNGILDELQICAGHPDGNDSCQGDSGGPLMQVEKMICIKFHYIVGITSFGKACGVADSAGVYTRVSNYREWIEDIVWPDVRNNTTHL